MQFHASSRAALSIRSNRFVDIIYCINIYAFLFSKRYEYKMSWGIALHVCVMLSKRVAKWNWAGLSYMYTMHILIKPTETHIIYMIMVLPQNADTCSTKIESFAKNRSCHGQNPYSLVTFAKFEWRFRGKSNSIVAMFSLLQTMTDFEMCISDPHYIQSQHLVNVHVKVNNSRHFVFLCDEFMLTSFNICKCASHFMTLPRAQRKLCYIVRVVPLRALHLYALCGISA